MTQIVMPYMTEGIAKHVPEFEAWRWAFFLPGGLFCIITLLILVLGQVCLVATGIEIVMQQKASAAKSGHLQHM